jgi:adenosylmethionine-8-amino-7-oxononanoate aminotransferase
MAGETSHVFRRSLNPDLPFLEKSEGNWIVDSDGRRYLDASGGAVVVNLGHARQDLASAVADQMSLGFYAHPTMFTSRPVEELAAGLAAHAPDGISRFYFMTTGSEAVETAIKLARQIHLANDRPQRFKLISRWGSYHGLTLGALAATGRTSFRAPFAPMINDAHHIPPPYCLRCSFGLEFPGCGLRCAQALEEAILAMGPDTVSAFLAEPVSGATIAAVTPPDGYWELVADICRRHGVLLILDEVMTGMGRTGRWFASEHYGVIPDLVTMGKGLSGGSLPLSAVGVQEKHYQAVVEAGGFAHGGTFSHHPVCAAAGLAALRVLESEELVERAAETGQALGRELGEALAGHPNVVQVRGLGMLWGVEFARDKNSLEPFPRGEKLTERLWQHLFEHKIIVYKSTGLAGRDGDALVVAPPFTLTGQERGLLVQRLKEAVDGVLGTDPGR